MKAKINKTNAIRVLDTLKIDYELREYEVDDQHLGATHVAASLGVNPEDIYKTLVLQGSDVPYIVAVIPSNMNIDMKKLAKVSGNKSVEMLPLQDLLQITGYIRGGCSPIGMKKAFPTYIESLATLQDQICVSAGKRGLQVILSPSDLASTTHAQFEDIAI